MATIAQQNQGAAPQNKRTHKPVRPTKAERGAATRARLLDATIDCLVELGWSGTSTTEVVRRAGVSRGAQVHHFPTKEDLVVAAMERLEQRRIAEYRSAFESLPVDGRTPDAAFDLLRSVASGVVLDAWLELAIATRTHPVLRERFIEFEQRFIEGAIALNQELLLPSGIDPAFARVAVRFPLCVIDGLALARLGGASQAELDEVAEAFKFVTAPFATFKGADR